MQPYSRSSVYSLKPIFYVLSCLLFVPFYDFKTMKRVYSKLQLLLFVLYFISALCVIRIGFQDILKHSTLKRYLPMEIILLGFGFVSNGWIIVSTLLNGNHWESLLEILYDLEQRNKLNTINNREKNLLKVPSVQLFLGIVTIYGVNCYGLMGHQSGIYGFIIYRILSFLGVMVFPFNIVNIFIMLKVKYEYIEGILQNDLNVVNLCRKCYQDLYRATKALNKISGGGIFLVYFFCGFKLVFATSSSIRNYTEKNITFQLFLTIVLVNLLALVIPLAISYFAHEAQSQARKLQQTCHKILVKLNENSERYVELKDFYEQIQRQQVKFTAERFFNLERATTTSYLHVICNYFITSIQFVMLLP